MEMFRAMNKPSRNGYDMSVRNRFTAKAGEILPVYSKLLRKGDKVKIHQRNITNTRPLNSDAYTSVREYYNWYFVPMNLLWDKFNVWSVDLKENAQVASSINGNQPLSEKHPYFTTGQIYDVLSGLDNLTEENNKLNPCGFERGKLARKLLHYLDYGDFYKSESSIIKNLEMSPWRLLAYQKIYQDYYRDSQWENSRPALFNLNYMDGSEGTNQMPLDEVDLTKWTMFDIRYANWNKDYFMGLLPNSQYGDAASINIDTESFDPTTLSLRFPVLSSSFTDTSPLKVQISSSDTAARFVLNARGGQSVGDVSGSPIDSNGAIGADEKYVWFRRTLDASLLNELRSALGLPDTTIVSSSSVNSSLQSAFTILALRQAEALQKYKEIKMANKQDFPSQVFAQEGVKPSNAYSQRCQWLKGVDGTIDINPVVNTNLADQNAALVRGRGISASQGEMNFDTDVDGVLMCIYHAAPVLDYAIDGVHPDNTKTYLTDYANPIFDKTGMQQVNLAHLFNNWPDTALGFAGDENLLGYGPIYLDYKTDYSRIHGAFYNGGLQQWVAPITAEYIKIWLEGNQSGDYSVWAGLNVNFFKINPSTLNPIFTTPVDSDVNSDQFWCNAYFDVKMVRNLDRDGLPY